MKKFVLVLGVILLSGLLVGGTLGCEELPSIPMPTSREAEIAGTYVLYSYDSHLADPSEQSCGYELNSNGTLYYKCLNWDCNNASGKWEITSFTAFVGEWEVKADEVRFFIKADTRTITLIAEIWGDKLVFEEMPYEGEYGGEEYSGEWVLRKGELTPPHNPEEEVKRIAETEAATVQTALLAGMAANNVGGVTADTLRLSDSTKTVNFPGGSFKLEDYIRLPCRGTWTWDSNGIITNGQCSLCGITCAYDGTEWACMKS